MLKTTIWALPLALMLALSACVTINIYFPAAAAEKAADRIIDDVWQLKEKTDGKAVPADSNSKQENK
ncbi:hypothetical protein LG201_05805 [Methylobacillus gramineus]|uniref:hypothetical protein n=1 Tax=Methylobacillus gramineus TaxID=755169 RepID=UPI001CFF7B45|nr:hypothetical protein [Methylobacillus gramineus]MCB5184713.1 hypothetical protein [Methylobacillus gramineus]